MTSAVAPPDPHAGEAQPGLTRVRFTGAPAARRILEAQTGGTPVLRTSGVGCRALEDTETFAAFALWTGPGM